jgi:hypothetical protein
MACRGVHFAITAEESTGLLSAPDDEAVLALVQDVIEEKWDEDWLYQSDKSWDAIHRCLTDGTLRQGRGTYPLKLAVLGGRRLYSADDYIIALISQHETRDVAVALTAIPVDRLKARYDAIDAVSYGAPKTADDWEYIWENFVGLAEFYRKAAAAGRCVLFTVDQ